MEIIMIVDDDATSRAICKAHLGTQYKTVTMNSGIQALGYLKNNPVPDLILLDEVMPGINGMEVLKILKSQPETQNIPVIFATSSNDIDFVIDGYRCGAADFIQKPIIPILLIKKVEFLIFSRRMEEENRYLRQSVMDLKLQLMKYQGQERLAQVITGNKKAEVASKAKRAQTDAGTEKISQPAETKKDAGQAKRTDGTKKGPAEPKKPGVNKNLPSPQREEGGADSVKKAKG